MQNNFFYLLFFFVGFLCETSSSQNSEHVVTKEKKNLECIYTETIPKIDGYLEEPIWAKAAVASGFIQNRPIPNTKPSQKTEVRIIYTSESICIGAKLYDSAPDSILKQLCTRDKVNVANADRFSIYIDGMYTEQNDFEFTVTAAGVQADANNGDRVWNAVWKSAVQIEKDAWVVEMEIPYSQLRFPKSDSQIWGLNFGRVIRRHREESFWSKIDPKIDGNVQQYGLLKGLDSIDPPIRLSFTPYAATYIQHYKDQDPTTSNWTPIFSAGADLKYGINESFTLDVALIPDFGDVQSDNFQFNLSPFEVYYAEQRPFFTEGVELFNRADIFYSRRVGSRPSRYFWAENQVDSTEILSKNPSSPQLINALKISGRGKKGLGLGLFNALTAPSFARIKDTILDTERKIVTEPLSNYNVFVLDQQFRNNSFVSLINTSVFRPGSFADAIVTGLDFRITDINNMYAISGNSAFSQQFLDSNLFEQEYENGYRYALRFGKVSGRFRFVLEESIADRNFNPNDLGFFTVGNYINHELSLRYNVYQPFWIYNKIWSYFNSRYNMLYQKMKYTKAEVSGGIGGVFQNFLGSELSFVAQPWGIHDYFEARNGQVWEKPAWGRISGWLSSDYRKVFAFDMSFSYRWFDAREESIWRKSDVLQGWFSPRIRFSDRMNIILESNLTLRRNNFGYVNSTSNGAIIFGSRFRQDVENLITINYLFTNRMSLSFRARHYWAYVEYDNYYNLEENGKLAESTYTANHDLNYNAFNLDLIYRWWFAPGSELNIVWKNSVLESGDVVEYNFFKNFGQMFNEGQANQFSIKVLYFLDYFQWKKKKR